MNKTALTALVISVSLLIAGDYSSAPRHGTRAVSPSPSSLKEKPRYVEGELLVKYRGSVPEAARALGLGEIGARKLREFAGIGVEHVKLPAGMAVEEGLSVFRANPDVEYAEPNYIVKAEAVPDDPRYNELWGLNIIDAPGAWDITNGVSSVVVAVVDTGVDYNHPDLQANIWNNAGETSCTNGIDDDGNGYPDDCRGWDFSGNDNDPMDIDVHGTHVAGIIGATGNNGIGVAGVNWRVSIMPLRFLDSSGFGDIAGAIAAIDYARTNGARVVNCSWGSYGYSQALKDTIDVSPAVLFVCAAGNDGLDTEINPHYPSGLGSANVISVGASDSADNLAHYSNFGLTSVDVAAPGGGGTYGTGILSTVPARKTIWSDSFDDGSLSPWTTGGTKNSWALEYGVYNSPNYSLSDSPSYYYSDDTDSWAKAPAQSLASETGCRLSYEIKYGLEDGYDFLCVEASSDNSSFSIIGGGCFTGFSSGWEHWDDDLSAFDGKSSVYVRYRLKSDYSYVFDGANVDDVSITCSSSVHTDADYKEHSGTSMAAPHVAGIAALMVANSPSVSPREMKHLIHFSVDKIPSMAGKVGSGGRANALAALTTGLAGLPPFAPSDLHATSGTSAVLTWKDNSSDEEGFVLERRFGDSGEFMAFPPLPANATSYTDTGLLIGAKYYYRVKALNSTRGDSPYSRAVLSYSPRFFGGGGGGIGCFIATAAYGSAMAPEVELLRRFRDKRLMGSAPGRLLVGLYYRFSPPLADFIRERPALRLAARLLLAPVVFGVRHPLGALALCMFTTAAALVKIGNRRNNAKRRRQ